MRKKRKKTQTPHSALKRGAAVGAQSALISSGSVTISIANFLQYVKTIPLAKEKKFIFRSQNII
jgi:hypothetical protein